MFRVWDLGFRVLVQRKVMSAKEARVEAEPKNMDPVLIDMLSQGPYFEDYGNPPFSPAPFSGPRRH